jgi:hypothetical protein
MREADVVGVGSAVGSGVGCGVGVGVAVGSGSPSSVHSLVAIWTTYQFNSVDLLHLLKCGRDGLGGGGTRRLRSGCDM